MIHRASEQNPLGKLSLCTICLEGKGKNRLRRVSIEINNKIKDFDLCIGCCQKPINEVVMSCCID